MSDPASSLTVIPPLHDGGMRETNDIYECQGVSIEHADGTTECMDHTCELEHELHKATRRLAFVVDFPFPGDAERRRIWELTLAGSPLAAGVDLDLLARGFRLSGGSIRNAALQAAFLAAGDGTPVGMPHLLDAVRRELRKMGKVAPDTAAGLLAGAD